MRGKELYPYQLVTITLQILRGKDFGMLEWFLHNEESYTNIKVPLNNEPSKDCFLNILLNMRVLNKTDILIYDYDIGFHTIIIVMQICKSAQNVPFLGYTNLDYIYTVRSV